VFLHVHKIFPDKQRRGKRSKAEIEAEKMQNQQGIKMELGQMVQNNTSNAPLLNFDFLCNKVVNDAHNNNLPKLGPTSPKLINDGPNNNLLSCLGKNSSNTNNMMMKIDSDFQSDFTSSLKSRSPSDLLTNSHNNSNVSSSLSNKNNSGISDANSTSPPSNKKIKLDNKTTNNNPFDSLMNNLAAQNNGNISQEQALKDTLQSILNSQG